VVLEAAKVAIRLDQPGAALELYAAGLQVGCDHSPYVCIRTPTREQCLVASTGWLLVDVLASVVLQSFWVSQCPLVQCTFLGHAIALHHLHQQAGHVSGAPGQHGPAAWQREGARGFGPAGQGAASGCGEYRGEPLVELLQAH
jgi:hypothetical protein